MADSFDELTARFLSWFKQLPGATFSDAIAIQDLRSRNAGRGIIALRDIPAETVLFTIPRASILSVETSALRAQLPSLFAAAASEGGGTADDDDAPPPLDAWSALILVLLYEHLQRDADATGAACRWRPYLDVLPAAFATPMFWSPAELGALQASPAVAKVGRESADNMFRGILLPAVRAHAHVFAGSERLSDEQIVALAHRMGSTIMAYAFDLDKEEDEDEDGEDGWVEDRDGKALMGMVPMADILNADAEFNVHVNHGDDDLTVTALRPIRAGEEILNYYGPHPNSELLRRYGYVTERHARYDVVEIPWELIEAAAVSQLNLPQEAWAKVRGHLDEDEMEDSFVLERDCPEVTAEGLFPDAAPAQFTGLPGDLQEQLTEFLRAVRAVDPALVPDKRKREELQAAIAARALAALEAQYPTTLAQDEQLLATAAMGDRERMALIVRVGEKRLLREARAFLESSGPLQQQHGGASSTVKRARLE
ncbi:SET domain-containing protein RMS1 [Cordyceps militaris CM01]|uniref:SET domain-containing protein RMS1 n=1 Tax=Cordyceps militaris (strain CM01) TaxID=983644 RepID=G3JA69_CORMM|nr:SET domain-containing protein RMS1 [Cordyceps militaris CM01]EGX94239.1 SET domain-containing protein RMS1 [Cordyceps militaris CM01]